MKVFLWTWHLTPVHVHEQEFHVFEVDILEDYNGVFARIAKEEMAEVRAAYWQDQLVGWEIVLATW